MRLQDCRDSRPKQAGRRAGRGKTMAYMQTRRTGTSSTILESAQLPFFVGWGLHVSIRVR